MVATENILKDLVVTDGVIDPESLDSRLTSGKKLVVKLGVDPTAPDLHLGHVVVLTLLKRFQELGHQTYLVIGDFTAMIGDPSGRSAARPILTQDEIEANVQTYIEQAGKVLNLDRTKIVNNSSWLSAMTAQELIEFFGHISLNTLIAREDFAKRLASGLPVGLQELVYPVLQAIDSYQLKADVELGGQDQRLNLLAVRDIQKKLGQNPEDIIMTKILIGTDGKRKMSKSYDNYIGVSEVADEQFGKIMSIPDSLIDDYAQLVLGMNAEVRRELLSIHPRDAKMKLAQAIVAKFHDQKAAKSAADNFRQIYQQGSVPEDKYIQKHFPQADLLLDDLVSQVGQVSKSEATRLITQEAIKINGQLATDARLRVNLSSEGLTLHIGKHGFYKIKRR